MFKLFKYFDKKEWLFLALLAVLTLFEVWLELKLPDYMQAITTVMATGGSVGEVLKNGGLMLACALGAGLIAVTIGYSSSMIGTGLSRRLRSEMYAKVGTFSPTEMHKFSTSSLITRSTNDISQIQQTISMGFQVILRAPVTAVWAICKIVSKSFQWSVATAIAVAVMLIFVIVVVCLVVPKFKVVQKKTDDLNRITTENLTGLRVVRAFNAEGFMQDKFEATNKSLKNTQLFTSRATAFINPMINLVMNGLSVAIYVIGAYLINSAGMAQKVVLYSDMMVFFSYAMQIISSFMMLVMIFMIMPRAIVSAKRVNEVLDTKSSVVDGVGANPTEVGTVKFDNVSFAYADGTEPVLKDISFEAKKGETVAIIGATGCGKSTIVKLIPRLYDATSGTVLVDGVDVKNYKLQDLYNKIGYVSQRAVMFSGTVASNVSMGVAKDGKVGKEQVESAIEQAQAKKFVEKMSSGYESGVTQGGTNLSGGQKQRLSIARAIAKKPEILIFDDSFSALDYQTDKQLRRAIKQNLGDTTCIIVAQRIGTIKNCDKILVIEDGKIVDSGTHQQLLKTSKVYQEIALSQLSKEELNG